MKSKRIIIFSQENDQSTCDVIAWLNILGAKFIRINMETNIDFIGYEIDKMGDTDLVFRLRFGINNEIYKLSEFDSCWYRRGLFPIYVFGSLFTKYQNDKNSLFFNSLERSLKLDYDDLLNSIHFFTEQKKCLSKFSTSSNNKLLHFQIANSFGIKVPPTLITNSKLQLLNFFNLYKGEIITKAISNPVMQNALVDEEFVSFASYTVEVKKEWIDQLPDNFYISKFQYNIPKAYEVRAFFLDGAFYSMAILSQFDQQTSVDFRRYNKRKPNRNIPYQLPIEIEDKLRRFMKEVALNTGSIDLIITPQKEYYFLEVNPVGQFGMTSIPCNYNLEKKIAQFLYF